MLKKSKQFIGYLLSGFSVYNEEKMNLLWVEEFPLFLPKEDGSEGELQFDSLTSLSKIDQFETVTYSFLMLRCCHHHRHHTT